MFWRFSFFIFVLELHEFLILILCAVSRCRAVRSCELNKESSFVFINSQRAVGSEKKAKLLGL